MRRTARVAVVAGLLLSLGGCTGGSAAPTADGGPDKSATLWAVGDGPNGKPASVAVGKLVGSRHPDYLLYLGDVYGRYGELFPDTYGAALARRTLPTPGNHEWPSQKNGYLAYWKQVTGHTQPTFYSRRVAGWQIISLNSEEAAGPGSPQYLWLKDQLDAADGTCRIAFWHEPRFSAGQHGDSRQMDPLWELLAGKSVAVISGHDHTMQRLKPVDGVTQFVSGAGGRSHYRIDESDPRLAFADNTHDGALELQLGGTRLRYRFVAVGGQSLDSGTLRCSRAG
jgi:hypothetical protein